ncbi:hypothetical protein ID866_8107, partial [Astraeus odoratus]
CHSLGQGKSRGGTYGWNCGLGPIQISGPKPGHLSRQGLGGKSNHVGQGEFCHGGCCLARVTSRVAGLDGICTSGG